jgi:hypothetical protein
VYGDEIMALGKKNAEVGEKLVPKRESGERKRSDLGQFCAATIKTKLGASR